jgi:hypothetical protein
MPHVQSRQTAFLFFGRVSEVFVAEFRHTVGVEIRRIWLAAGHFLAEAWNRGLDEPDARRQFDSRAQRIFDAIMTDRCEEFSRPSRSVDRRTD